jgi:hypothetical protein
MEGGGGGRIPQHKEKSPQHIPHTFLLWPLFKFNQQEAAESFAQDTDISRSVIEPSSQDTGKCRSVNRQSGQDTYCTSTCRSLIGTH